MSARDEDYDSDAPEEFTSEQGLQQDVELRKVEMENKARVAREGKERRRKWAQKKTPKSKPRVVDAFEAAAGPSQGAEAHGEMLPDNIVKLLVAREKQVFASDSEEEKEAELVRNSSSKKKSRKSSGLEPVILKEIPPSQCLQNSLEFLKKRKMQVSRSTSVLDNSHQALRLLSGLLSKK